jgi:hypothetical protein
LRRRGQGLEEAPSHTVVPVGWTKTSFRGEVAAGPRSRILSTCLTHIVGSMRSSGILKPLITDEGRCSDLMPQLLRGFGPDEQEPPVVTQLDAQSGVGPQVARVRSIQTAEPRADWCVCARCEFATAMAWFALSLLRSGLYRTRKSLRRRAEDISIRLNRLRETHEAVSVRARRSCGSGPWSMT